MLIASRLIRTYRRDRVRDTAMVDLSGLCVLITGASSDRPRRPWRSPRAALTWSCSRAVKRRSNRFAPKFCRPAPNDRGGFERHANRQERISALPRLDALVNNAGQSIPQPFETSTNEVSMQFSR